MRILSVTKVFFYVFNNDLLRSFTADTKLLYYYPSSLPTRHIKKYIVTFNMEEANNLFYIILFTSYLRTHRNVYVIRDLFRTHNSLFHITPVKPVNYIYLIL